MVKPKSNIVNLPVYQPGKPIEAVKRELGLTDITKLASNENPFGCSPKAKEAIVGMLDQASLYPDGASVELSQALAQKLQVHTNQLIYGTGSDEVILMIARAFIVAGDEAIMATHTFPIYKHNCTVEGAVCIEVPLVEGAHDLQGMLNKVTDKTKIIWICNPNNPTGTIVTKEELLPFLKQVPSNVLVVLDEAYCEYVTAAEYPDGLSLLNQFKNLLLLRTFSKIYGLASLRIGYAVGDPEIIRYINQVREPFNTTRFSQAAAVAALADQAFIDQCRSANEKGRRYLIEEFSKLGLTSLPAHGNFIMVDVKRPAGEVFNALMRKGFIVRGGHQLGFPTSLRVTVGTEQQNQKFIQALTEVLQETAVKA